MLEEKIDALIVALEQNTCALMEKPGVGAVKSAKPETAKKKGRGKGKAAAAKDTAITVESIKAFAKKISMESEDPIECITQIREVVSTVAEGCYENATIGIDALDATGLTLLHEELTKFVYTPPSDDKKETAPDELEI